MPCVWRYSKSATVDYEQTQMRRVRGGVKHVNPRRTTGVDADQSGVCAVPAVCVLFEVLLLSIDQIRGA